MVDEKFKILYLDDKAWKIFHELLSNEKVKQIITLLSVKESYQNEIAETLGISRQIVNHHIKRMKEIGIIKVTNKKLVKRGDDHEFYQIVPGVFIDFKAENYQQALGKAANIFKNTTKFSLIPISGVITWLITSLNQTNTWGTAHPMNDNPITFGVIASLSAALAILLIKKRKD